MLHIQNMIIEVMVFLHVTEMFLWLTSQEFNKKNNMYICRNRPPVKKKPHMNNILVKQQRGINPLTIILNKK